MAEGILSVGLGRRVTSGMPDEALSGTRRAVLGRYDSLTTAARVQGGFDDRELLFGWRRRNLGC
jgi:hypothetical protein